MTDAPILVVGVTQRSGTNFLADLLGCHADTTPARDPYREDFAFSNAAQLAAWSDRIVDRLPSRWGDDSWVRASLRASLGQGLAQFLSGLGVAAGRPVVKTPFAAALDGIRALDADIAVVVIVRDAPAVVTSMVAGFGSSLEWAAHVWRDGARSVLAWRDAVELEGCKPILVRYEDLVADRRTALTPVLAALGLNPSAMDWAAGDALAVRGSSHAPGGLDWSDAADQPELIRTPLRARQTLRVDAVAGLERAALGYAAGGDRRLADVGLDALWPVRQALTATRLGVLRRVLKRH